VRPFSVEPDASSGSDQLVARLRIIQPWLTLEAQAERCRSAQTTLTFELDARYTQGNAFVAMDEHHSLASRDLPGQDGPIKDFNARTRELFDF